MVARDPQPPRKLTVRSWDTVARELLAKHAIWSVHSAFQRSFNLVAESGSLLGVVAMPYDAQRADTGGNGPATLVLAHAGAVPEFDIILAPHDEARLAGTRLIVAGRLALELAPAALWSPPPIRLTLEIQEIAERIVRARSRAAVLAPREGFGPLLADTATGPPDVMLLRASALLDNLSTAIRARQWEDVLAPARALSGLGPGLTPAGDDVLAGLALGVMAALGTLPGPLAAALHTAVEGRTTDLAVARVRHAVAGRADEAVHQLLSLLVDRRAASAGDLDAAVRGIVGYGHSSGADTLVGIDRGLRLGVALLVEERPA